MRGLWPHLVVAFVSLMACSGNDSAQGDLDQAGITLRDFIERPVEEVLPGRPTELADGSGRQLCDAATSDDEREDYGLRIDVAAEDWADERAERLR